MWDQYIVAGIACIIFGLLAIGYAYGRKESRKVILTPDDAHHTPDNLERRARRAF